MLRCMWKKRKIGAQNKAGSDFIVSTPVPLLLNYY